MGSTNEVEFLQSLLKNAAICLVINDSIIDELTSLRWHFGWHLDILTPNALKLKKK